MNALFIIMNFLAILIRFIGTTAFVNEVRFAFMRRIWCTSFIILIACFLVQIMILTALFGLFVV